MISTVRRTLAALSLAAGVGAATLIGLSTTALAPEPAKLGATNLASTAGSWVTGAYVGSKVETTIVNWPSSLRSIVPGLQEGQPCSPVGLAAYSTTRYSIVFVGTQAKCIGPGPVPGSAGNPRRPVASDGVVEVYGSVSITLWASDPDGQKTTFSIERNPTRGTLGEISDSTCSDGVPNICTATVFYDWPGELGGDSFSYTASDGALTSKPATIDLPSFSD